MSIFVLVEKVYHHLSLFKDSHISKSHPDLITLYIINHDHEQTYSSHEVILALGISIPDSHHKTLPLNLTNIHLMIISLDFFTKKISNLKIKSFIEIWFNVLAKHICLFVFPLKVALLCYLIKKVNSGIWILASLAKKFSLSQVNIETASPIVYLNKELYPMMKFDKQ